ncbi:hypothetical protein LA52FAK_01960 [Desulforhopalus sp. 52FAK]
MQGFKQLHIKSLLILVSAIAMSLMVLQVTAGASTFHAIAYHGVASSNTSLSSDDITIETLVNHFEWLHANGYNPVSIDQLIDAEKGTTPLPDKAVLLCWDDGYSNFYTHVLPLLKAYNYPALLALVGSWMTKAEGEMVLYGDTYVARETFLSWEQIRAISNSDLVEIASHSFNLHKGLLADEYGDILPATITHIYDSTTDDYESDVAMKKRITQDLKKNNRLIEEKTGRSPRAMVWPFGRYNQLAIDVAREVGMPITLTLDPVAASLNQLNSIPRAYPTLNPETGSFKYSFFDPNRPPLRRFAQIKTTDILEENDSQEILFSTFLERVKNISPGRIYLDPVIEKDEKIATIFRNKVLPTIQDRLLRLTWHTNRRAGTEVHITLSEQLFQSVQQEEIVQFLSDMGRSAPCSGLLLDHSNFLSLLLDTAGSSTLLSDPPPTWNPNFTRHYRQQLIKETKSTALQTVLGAVEAFQYWQPFLDIGLLIPLSVIEHNDAHTLKKLLIYFDYIMVDAKTIDKASQIGEKIVELKLLKKVPPYAPVMVNFNADKTSQELTTQLRQLQAHGIIDYGYSFDDFTHNNPRENDIIPVISTRSYPFIPK